MTLVKVFSEHPYVTVISANYRLCKYLYPRLAHEKA